MSYSATGNEVSFVITWCVFFFLLSHRLFFFFQEHFQQSYCLFTSPDPSISLLTGPQKRAQGVSRLGSCCCFFSLPYSDMLWGQISRADYSFNSWMWFWKAWVISKQKSLKCIYQTNLLPPTNKNSLYSTSEVDYNSCSKRTRTIVLR